jgi:hypothetical protein
MGECCYRVRGGSTWEGSALIGVDEFAVDGVIVEAECHNAFKDLGDGLDLHDNSN